MIDDEFNKVWNSEELKKARFEYRLICVIGMLVGIILILISGVK